MRRKIPLLLGGIALISLSLLKTEVRAVDQTFTVTISQGAFSQLNVTMDRLDAIKFQNQDNQSHVLRLEPDGFVSNIKSKTLEPASEGAGPSSYSPTFTDAQVGVWKYFIVGQEQQGGTLTVTAAVATATPTVSASPSSTVTSSPSVSPTATSTPTLSPSPTQTVTPTATPSATPSMTATPTVSPTMTSSASPSVTATPSMSPTPSLHPSVSPTASSTVHPTASATPMPTPQPEDSMPGFSLFRSTQCSAEVVGNTVLTERLSAAKLTRGYWDIQKLVSQNGQTTVDVDLDHVRVVNLFFRSTFFHGDVTYNNVHQQATFQGSSLNNVLQSAATTWCQSAMRY